METLKNRTSEFFTRLSSTTHGRSSGLFKQTSPSIFHVIDMPMSSPIKVPPIHITESPPTLSPLRHGVGLKGRRRSSSLVKVEKVGETQEELLDQSVYVNVNVEWVNRKGEPRLPPMYRSTSLNQKHIQALGSCTLCSYSWARP